MSATEIGTLAGVIVALDLGIENIYRERSLSQRLDALQLTDMCYETPRTAIDTTITLITRRTVAHSRLTRAKIKKLTATNPIAIQAIDEAIEALDDVLPSVGPRLRAPRTSRTKLAEWWSKQMRRRRGRRRWR
jgi:hypothetical protein